MLLKTVPEQNLQVSKDRGVLYTVQGSFNQSKF
jgi:hypothetical protein